jgi:hypothetical protein
VHTLYEVYDWIGAWAFKFEVAYLRSLMINILIKSVLLGHLSAGRKFAICGLRLGNLKSKDTEGILNEEDSHF